METAGREDRVILTFDKDFGELVFRTAGSVATGVVLFRLSSASPEGLVPRMVQLLGSRTDWVGMFSVVDSNKLRMRPIRSGDRNR